MELAIALVMAHLWIADPPDGWALVPLPDGGLPLSRVPGLEAAARATLIGGSHPGGAWVLVGTELVRINGFPLVTGVHALVDRDEIRLAGAEPAYFSTERRASPEPLPHSDRALACPRCRTTMLAGTPAVRCPGCSVWHHASDEMPCWSYAPTCALCSQVTDLNAGFRWMPGER
jgi:hypothetical protein